MASSSKTKSKQSAARQWKRATAEEVTLPSGNLALVKRPGMEAFLLEGLIPDSLMGIVQEAINTGKGVPPAKMQEIISDPKKVDAMFDAMDRILCRVVVEPAVVWHKREKPDGSGDLEVIPEDERDPDTYIYTDEVFFDDKSFLFNYAVGGTRDLERFREETESTVASLQPGESVEVSSVGTAGD